MLLSRLKTWRLARGYSLRELAAKSKIPYSTISLLENLKREPHGRTARKLAEALGVDLIDLIELPAPPAPPPLTLIDNKTITDGDSSRTRKRPARASAGTISYWVIENDPDPDAIEPFRLDTRAEAERLCARLGSGRVRIYEAASKVQMWEQHRAFLVRVTRGQDHW